MLGATVGLDPKAVGRVRMCLDEGLTGLVAQQLAPVMVADAPMIWPAGHAPGQLAGYRVVPRVKVMLAVVAFVIGGDGWLLWNDALNRMPYGSG